MATEMTVGMRTFKNLIKPFLYLGDWHVRHVGSQSYDDVLVATLKGNSGRVEVWGGNLHAREVWVIGKDKSETLVELGYTEQSLKSALDKACRLAGVQQKMVVDGA